MAWKVLVAWMVWVKFESLWVELFSLTHNYTMKRSSAQDQTPMPKRKYSKVTTASSTQSHGLSGIRNTDNACYIIATVQFLYSIKEFRETLVSLRIPQPSQSFNPPIKVLLHLKDLFQKLYVSSTDIDASFAKLRTQCGHVNANWDNGSQQCANEFLSFLFDSIDSDWNTLYPSTPSIVDTLFKGWEQTSTVCSSCSSRVDHEPTPFHILNLSLNSADNVSSLFANYGAPATIEFNCTTASCTSKTAQYSIEITRMPKVLFMNDLTC